MIPRTLVARRMTATESVVDDNRRCEEAKIAINDLIWTHGSGALTLDEAELIACDFLAKIRKIKPGHSSTVPT